jgi:Kef-type K+ transport system membrane component KefB
MPAISHEVAFLLLIFALMVVPRAIQRFRIPAPLTSFGLGMAAAIFLAGFSGDTTLSLFATLGISSLFLFAGLEIDLQDFRRGKWPLLWHLAIRSIVLTAVTFLLMRFFGFTWQVAVLLGLAVLTPSTGFILDTLPMLDIDAKERYWVSMKAVSGELFALIVLFVVLQSASLQTLALSSAALAAMVLGLPLLFIGLGRMVIPYSHGSEFSLLLMVGVISAFLSYQLGVYYLVGAFLAGFIARLLRSRMPLLASDENLHAIKMFASFFVPFYFFYKGMGVPSGALTLEALGLGAALTLVALPARVGVVWLQRRFIKGEGPLASLRVAAALAPTLIFTLVLAGILRERFQISDALYGALLIYAGMSTMLPSVVMSKPVDFEVLHEPGELPQAPVEARR